MKKYVIYLALLALYGGFENAVNAAAVDGIPANGIVTDLHDDDWEVLVNRSGAGANPNTSILGNAGQNLTGVTAAANTRTVDDGDIFVGMVRMSYTAQGTTQIVDYVEGSDTVTPGETIAAVFAIHVVKLAANAYAAIPLTDSEWSTVGLNTIGFNRNSSNTIAIVFDDPDNVKADAVGNNPVKNDLQTVSGTRLWEFGFGADGESFWSVATFGGALPPSGTAPFGLFNAGLDVTHDYNTGPSLTAIPNSYLLGPGALGDSQVLIGGSVRGPGAPDSDFHLRSTADFYVLTGTLAPEPGSMVLLGMGTLGFFGVGARRRRQSVKQQAV